MSGYYFLFTPDMAVKKFPSKVESVTTDMEREFESFSEDTEHVELVPNNSKNLAIKNNSKLSDDDLSKSLKIDKKISWQSITVKPGESLALIFSRLGLSSNSLYKIMSLGKETSILKTLIPGDKLKFHIEDNQLIALQYEMELTKILKVSKKDNKFITEKINIKLDSITKNANGIINDSLFLSGQKAGLSANLIMQLVAIFGWDIDFVLDIRKGDSFTILYEEQYKNGTKVAEGPIIAAEFINQGKAIRAIRYSENNERSNYYAVNGDAMRKAFLRTPVDFFSRISSRFSLGRKHPVLNKIRAHKGVDYAAPMGTPVKATGDGVVAFAGKDGGFGRKIKLKHGGAYSTVYAHLQRIGKNIRRGKEVKQGQIIGYVGSTGLSTGPHLHYEVIVNGKKINSQKLNLPSGKILKGEDRKKFEIERIKTDVLLAETIEK